MTDSKVETRLDTLEQQVKAILNRISTSDSESRAKDWRRSLGMFDGHPAMKQIDEEGQRIRQQDREQVTNDRS